MIIWLASYPKSGNTWVRAMIASLLYSDDGNFNFNLLKKIEQFPEKRFFNSLIDNFKDFNKIKKNWIVAQEKLNLRNEPLIFKTHHGKYKVGNDNFTDTENTLAVIYIVRDPRTLVKSISNHYSLSLDKACSYLLSPEITGNTKSFEEREDGIPTLIGKWNDHFRSWTNNKNNLLLIKYEDLIKNPRYELEKIINFLKKYLNFKTNGKKNETILKMTNFDNLKKLENQGHFNENAINSTNNKKINFFYLGPNNKWKDSLDNQIIKKIEKNFSREMKELGYI